MSMDELHEPLATYIQLALICSFVLDSSASSRSTEITDPAENTGPAKIGRYEHCATAVERYVERYDQISAFSLYVNQLLTLAPLLNVSAALLSYNLGFVR